MKPLLRFEIGNLFLIEVPPSAADQRLDRLSRYL
jgi:hypothetical protein